MSWYVSLVTKYPIATAMVQFAILGTFGDIVSKWLVRKKIYFPFDAPTLVLKMAEWAVLAVCIKYAFVGFQGFVDGLIGHALLPKLSGAGRALAVSTLMNLQFGPFLVIAHRLLDNLIARKRNWKNLDKGFLSLLWFWIPAHTVTFSLARPFQIGLAAVWSVVLGVILGFYSGKNADSKENPSSTGKVGNMSIRNMNDFPREAVPAGTRTFKQVLIGPDQADHFFMRRFIIEPGGEMPLHTNTVEHEQLVLGGRARLIMDGKEFEAKKNDIVFIPAGAVHSYKTLGEEAFEFLCLVPNATDTVALVR